MLLSIVRIGGSERRNEGLPGETKTCLQRQVKRSSIDENRKLSLIESIGLNNLSNWIPQFDNVGSKSAIDNSQSTIDNSISACLPIPRPAIHPSPKQGFRSCPN